MIQSGKTYYFLLVIIAIQSIGWNNSYAYQADFNVYTSSTVHHEENKEIVLTFKNADAIFWIEKNREFRFQGKMYDVKSFKYANGVLEITCELDEFETAVNREKDQFSQSKDKEVRFSIDANGKLIQKTEIEVTPSKKNIIQHCELFPIGYKEIDRPPP